MSGKDIIPGLMILSNIIMKYRAKWNETRCKEEVHGQRLIGSFSLSAVCERLRLRLRSKPTILAVGL